MKVAVAIAASLLVACKSDVVTKVDVDTSIAFFAVLDRTGTFVESGRLLAGQDRTAILGSNEGALWIWRMPADTIVGVDGRPLDDDALEEVTLTAQPKCRRCPVPSGAAPLRLGSAEACPAPAFGSPTGYGADGLAIDGPPPPLFLERAGSCPAPPARAYRSAQHVDVCPLWPVDGRIQTTAIAVNGDGAVFGLREGFVYRVSPEGDVEEHPTELPHREIQGVTGLASGDTFYFGVKEQGRGVPGLLFYGAQPGGRLGRAPWESAWLESPVSLSAMPSDPSSIYVFGRGAGTSGLARCEHTRFPCFGQAVSECGEATRRTGITDTDAGAPLVLGASGALYVPRESPDSWICRDALLATPLFTERTPSVRFTITEARHITALGDRWFACAVGEAQGRRTAMISGALDPAGAPVGNAEVVASVQGGDCVGIGVLPNHPDEVVANVGAGLIVARADGSAKETYDAWQHAIGTPYRPNTPEAVIGPFVQGATAAYVTTSGRVYRSRPNRDFERVYGASILEQPGGAIAQGDDAAIAFVPAHGPVRVTHRGGGCDGFEVEPGVEGSWTLAELTTNETTTSTTFPGDRAERYTEAARLRDDLYLLAGSDGRRSWFVRTIDLRTRSIVNRFIANERVLDLKAIDERRALMITNDAVMLVDAETMTVDALPIVWDDPSTPAVEQQLFELDGLVSIGVAERVAWITGGSAILRVIATPDDVRVEGWWSTTLRSEATQDLDFGAVRVLAPDRWIGMAFDPIPLSTVPTSAWRLGPEDDCPDAAVRSNGLGLCPYPGFAFLDNNGPENSDRALGVVGPEDNLTWTFSTGTVYRYFADRAMAPVARPANLVEVGETIVMSGEGPLVGIVPRR